MAEVMDKNRLYRYVSLEMEYQSQLERLERLENDTLLPAMQEGDGSQRSILKSSRMEKAAIRKMEAEKRINAKIDSIIDEMAKIEDAVDSLKDPLQREVLRLRYIDGEGYRHTRWCDISCAIYGDDEERNLRQVYRIHGQALKELRKGEW